VDETRLMRMILVRLDRHPSCREVRDYHYGSAWTLSSVCLPESRPSARSNHQATLYARQQGCRE
jgi:hypothetical protein